MSGRWSKRTFSYSLCQLQLKTLGITYDRNIQRLGNVEKEDKRPGGFGSQGTTQW